MLLLSSREICSLGRRKLERRKEMGGEGNIDISGMSKAKVLVALYNAAKPQGMGFLHYTPFPMSEKEAEELLEDHTYFDYVHGRVMKVDLSGDTLDSRLYDRDNGEGAALRAISSIKIEIVVDLVVVDLEIKEE